MGTGSSILLTQGKVALVDEADYKALMRYKWRAQRDRFTFYAVRSVGKVGVELMHRQILHVASDSTIEVDHANRDGLDNRRANLRRCSKSQNHQNQQPRSDRKSRFKGTSRYVDRPGLWRARIVVNGVRIHLGCFQSEEEAAAAYDAAALQSYGEFARTNFGEAETANGKW